MMCLACLPIGEADHCGRCDCCIGTVRPREIPWWVDLVWATTILLIVMALLATW